jgi:hypothetical protein
MELPGDCHVIDMPVGHQSIEPSGGQDINMPVGHAIVKPSSHQMSHRSNQPFTCRAVQLSRCSAIEPPCHQAVYHHLSDVEPSTVKLSSH